jgi:hypothetical protein
MRWFNLCWPDVDHDFNFISAITPTPDCALPTSSGGSRKKD